MQFASMWINLEITMLNEVRKKGKIQNNRSDMWDINIERQGITGGQRQQNLRTGLEN